MNILILVRSLDRGGAERQAVMLAHGLARQGHTVTLASFYTGGGWSQELQDTGLKTCALGKRGRWDNFGVIRRLLRLIRRENVAVLHSYLPVANLVALVAKFFVPDLKIIWGVRSSRVDHKAYGIVSALTYKLEQGLAGFASLIIANSEQGAAIYRKPNRSNVRVIHNGIDPRHFRPDKEAGNALRHELDIPLTVPLVSMVARIDPMKDYACFLKAAKLALEQRQDLRFICVGGPAEAVPVFRAKTEHMGLAHSVIWLGERDDLAAIYNACDVTTLISRGEGFPNVVAEAMACGCPCVASDVGAVGEIIGSHGTVVPANDPQKFCAAWLRLLDLTEQEKNELKNRARDQIVRKYSVDSLIDKTSDALQNLMCENA